MICSLSMEFDFSDMQPSREAGQNKPGEQYVGVETPKCEI